jgi:Hypervirulence associated proteins TUDOR domain
VLYYPVAHLTKNVTSTGMIVEVIKHDEVAETRHRTVHADSKHPKYLIRNDHTQVYSFDCRRRVQCLLATL